MIFMKVRKNMKPEQASILYEYEQILLGKCHSFTNSFTEDKERNQKIVIFLWKYVIENLLCWTPQQAADYLTPDTVKQLHLKNTISDKINFPYGLSDKIKPLYVLSLCYPHQIKNFYRTQAIDEYERVLASTKGKFSKNYFDDGLALKKAKYCLNYAITRFLPDYNIHQLYALFADTSAGTKWLSEHRLLEAQEALFPTPLDFFHYLSLKNSGFLYMSYKLNSKIGDNKNEKA